MIVLALSALLCLGISSAFLQSPLQRSRSGLVTRSGQTSFNSGHDPDMLDGSRPAFQMKELKTARDKASFKNKVPFDSDIYDIIRKLVELLGKRIETKVRRKMFICKLRRVLNILLNYTCYFCTGSADPGRGTLVRR